MELIRTEMTPRERLTRYAMGEEVDRIPTTLSAGETIPVLYGISIREYYFSADLMVEVESRLAEDFGADNMGMGLGLRTVAEALGTKLHYADDDLAYIAEPAITDYGQIERMKVINVERDGRLPIMLEAFSRLQDKYGSERLISTGMAGPLTTACALIGEEKFLRDCIRRPEEIEKLMEYSTECVIACAKGLHDKLGISCSLSEPMASGSLISLKQFKRWMEPYLKRTVAELNKFQGSTSLHICGKTRDRWQNIIDCGISGFWADNCESLSALKDFVGEKIAISGNVAPVAALLEGTPIDVALAVRKCIKDASDSPNGFTLCPGCTTPVGTPRENITAMMNSAYLYGKGAKKGRPCRGLETEGGIF